MSRNTNATSDSTQADKFRNLARELECDEDEAAFEEKVRKIAKAVVEGPDAPPTSPNSVWDEVEPTDDRVRPAT